MTASVLPEGIVVRTLQAWKTIVRKSITCSIQSRTLTLQFIFISLKKFRDDEYLSWGLEAQPDTFVVAGELFLALLATIGDQNTLLVLEDGGLLLISPLGLWSSKKGQRR